MQIEIKKTNRLPGTKGKKKTSQVFSSRGKDIDVDIYAQRVEKKAYELYEKRGRQNGRDWEDWFAAEQAVENEMILGK